MHRRLRDRTRLRHRMEANVSWPWWSTRTVVPFFTSIIRVNHERITMNADLHRFDPCFWSTAWFHAAPLRLSSDCVNVPVFERKKHRLRSGVRMRFSVHLLGFRDWDRSRPLCLSQHCHVQAQPFLLWPCHWLHSILICRPPLLSYDRTRWVIGDRAPRTGTVEKGPCKCRSVETLSLRKKSEHVHVVLWQDRFVCKEVLLNHGPRWTWLILLPSIAMQSRSSANVALNFVTTREEILSVVHLIARRRHCSENRFEVIYLHALGKRRGRTYSSQSRLTRSPPVSIPCTWSTDFSSEKE